MPCSPRRLGALLSLLMANAALHASEPADALRLAREVEPVAQSVALTLDPAKDDYSGRVVIDLLAHAPFTSFRLHAEGPALTAAMLRSADGVATPLTAAITDAAQGLVTLTAAAPLGAGNYQLTIDFTAKFHRDGLGLYKTISRGDPYLFTQFEDRQARKAFPCWDEPSFKINWSWSARLRPGAGHQ